MHVTTSLARRLAVLLALVIGIVAGTGPAANAAYYNEYSDVAATPNVSSTTAVQAFAAGSTYLYSVKTGLDDTRAVIYRVNKSSGARTVMTNATSGSSYNTWLGHANAMTMVDIAGVHHLFVVTMKGSGAQLVKLKYDGTRYWKVGSYQLRLDGAVAKASGISVVSASSTKVNFFLKSGRSVYRGSLGATATSGTVHLARAFTLSITGARVNGATVSDLGTFANQGFFYDRTRKVVYYPLTKENRSIVLVYRGIDWATSGTRTAATDLSFRITSSRYSKFEIEGVGVSGTRLYFNTNRSNANGSYDGVHVFKGYAVS